MTGGQPVEWVVARQAEMLVVRDRVIVSQAERIAQLERAGVELRERVERLRRLLRPHGLDEDRSGR